MKKFLKHIALGFLVFIVINALIAIKYEYPNYKAIKNKTHRNFLKWDAMHSNKNSYDLIVIGTSRSYAAFNPVVIDSILGVNSYNMGTSAQDIVETYYALQEIFEYQDPKYIVLDLFFESGDDSHDYYQIFSNSSFFKSKRRQLNLISEGYGSTGFLNYSIPLVKFKNYIKQDVISLFKNNKSLREENNWIKGHLHDTLTVTEEIVAGFGPISNFENTTFSRERFKTYFQKINELVTANDAQLICTRAPYPPHRFTLSDTDDEGNFFESYTAAENVHFIDINKIDNFNTIYFDTDFSDYHHANYRGAKKASEHLAEFIKLIN